MNETYLKEKYLGKKIEVPHKSEYGSESNTIAGICQFIGYNKHLPEWGLQVTIGRMPITNLDINQIKLL